MRIRDLRRIGLVVLLLALATGADWPQWRGPHRDGISEETGLLIEWPKEGPRLLWQVKDIGDGYSTPAVVGDRLYLLSNRGMADEFVQALDVKDGKQTWSTHIGKVGPNQGPQYPAARSTPTIDGESLYALGSNGDLACLETATGKIRWQKNLRSEFGGEPGMWAYSESPLIDGDVLVCTPGGSKAALVALKKHSGDVVWTCAIPGGDKAGYASAIAIDAAGVKQYVQFMAKGLIGVDAKTGNLLWSYEKSGKGSPANIPTPVAHEEYVYSSTPRNGGGVVKLVGSDGKINADQVYFERNLPVCLGGSVYLKGHLFGANSKELVCVEFLTGKIVWRNTCVGPSSLCYADGNLYVHGENGDVALVEATSDGYHEKGRFKPPEQPKRGQSRAWAYPVVANGRLYIRDLGSLWCYDVKKHQTGPGSQ